ncbi:MAG: HigA family addiction module antitoxin [Inquilinaceae bacterium]
MSMKIPPHPGRGLKDDFEALGLSTVKAAEALGMSRSQLHRIVAGESAITPELALRLEVVIGGTAEAWLRLQAAYDAAVVRARAGDITKGLKRIAVPA